MTNDLKHFLDKKVAAYNKPAFIADDPVLIPHHFTQLQDIEIAGFFAALLAWGTRKGIINSCHKLLEGMNNSPYEFVMEAQLNQYPKRFRKLEGFVHRTFNEQDLWHLINFLHHHYAVKQSPSLQTAFSQWMQPGDSTIENALTGFYEYVFNFNADASQEQHCRKHIATPKKKSACKRLNMFLRWMVRRDKAGVDFGLWQQIKPAQLVCPLDVHVIRVARKLDLLTRTQNDWQAAIELTEQCRLLDADDPVKYDFALFGLGVVEKF
jgi:uncharacterized protein (TIGR02757 family)